MRVHIGVIGEGRCSRRVARDAERIGAAIARAGAVLLTGGRGGVVVGILPGFARAEANRWVTVPIATGMDQARNVILVRSCDAIIAVGGMFGTLSEIGIGLKLGVPVVGLRTWRLAPPDPRRVPVIRATDPDDAVTQALSAANRRRGRARTWLA